MAVPASIEARLYYRCAFQRYEDAEILLRADRTTGAVYLAGYGVECMLKALLLATLPPAARRLMIQSFRGPRGHDFEWLRTQYLANGGARFPREITAGLTVINDWSTDLRYLVRALKKKEATGFLNRAATIIRWADGRI